LQFFHTKKQCKLYFKSPIAPNMLLSLSLDKKFKNNRIYYIEGPLTFTMFTAKKIPQNKIFKNKQKRKKPFFF